MKKSVSQTMAVNKKQKELIVCNIASINSFIKE